MFKFSFIALFFCLSVPSIAFSEAPYPNRAVRLVIPFATGGSNDIVGRFIADQLSKKLGEPFVVDNRGGAGGTMGTELVAKAKPDG